MQYNILTQYILFLVLLLLFIAFNIVLNKKLKIEQRIHTKKIVNNINIVASIATMVNNSLFVIGFVIEIDNIEEYNKQKLV